MNSKKNLFIGIWGYGVVGKAAVNYFLQNGYTVNLMDKRVFIEKELEYLKENNVKIYNEQEQEQFFNSSAIIIPSPGVNINEIYYATNSSKWITELDFFYHAFSKSIIAITGSVGKTSITLMLNHIFNTLSIPIAMGGNIGIPTFDLINKSNSVDFALLEVSSFQLMHCNDFAPLLSIWTNFHPNHLDYHKTESQYFEAKFRILKHQKDGSFSLVPWTLRKHLPIFSEKHTRGYFCLVLPDNVEKLKNNERLYYVNNNIIMRYMHDVHTPLMQLTPSLLQLSFLENILILAGVCDLLSLPITVLDTLSLHIEHRIEEIGNFNNILFYNDSKGTTTASTQAAVEKLYHRPLHLFLGGLSKGVDRTSFIHQIKNKVKHIYCFGKEAPILYNICNNSKISATYHNNLEDAVKICLAQVKAGDSVLLSPAGSSYDLYDNYEQRGNHFKELITALLRKYI